MTLDATQALDRLREGNRRFVSNQAAGHVVSDPTRRAELVAGQEPFAIILGCSDSRVPAELVFDQGFGDLFVIRVAGNIVAPSQIGSVEFAAARFGTRLVLFSHAAPPISGHRFQLRASSRDEFTNAARTPTPVAETPGVAAVGPGSSAAAWR